MPCLPINYTALAEASKSFDPTTPIYMLNLLKYRPQATYLPEHAALAGEPCTGPDAWHRYVTALGPLLPTGAARFFVGNVVAEAVVPKGESWDVVGINVYPSLDAFRKMVESRQYQEGAMPHRLAALEDFRLVVLDKLEF
ncbi:hypothetical protein K491DRAFT_716709 [Lophiostoma macrostomum CBS 122681]|uniref:DUF1330 domain-containing protein n=1 Tax=Lophiostoma macrostomum CBS 122681 TaxID=1314788 RepID=A0A6A6T8P8_9PLEO|nr:hypothetical protein K491DRAFT_716709 [Lophiostoma macrostomum CBS 122681]